MNNTSGPAERDQPEGGAADSRLAGVASLSGALRVAQSPGEVATLTAEHAVDGLGFPCLAVVYYDAETDRLEPAAQTPDAATELPTESFCGDTDGPLWDAFVADETRQVTAAVRTAERRGRVTDALAVPLGGMGVLLIATTAPDGFTAADRTVATTVASVVGNAATRADRSRRLSDCEATLAVRTDALSRFRSLIGMVRELSGTLFEAGAAPEIEAAVTERLVAADRYEMAAVCHYDAVTDETTLAEWAGDERGTLEVAGSLVDADSAGHGPIHRVVEGHGPQVRNTIVDEQPFTPWQQVALTRGYRACLALPLEYGETLYGALVVYSGQPDTFDELERDVLVELSHIVSHALDADESEKALVSNEVTELEFAVDDTNLEIVRLSRTLNCRFVMENLVSTSDGRLRVYFSTYGAPVAEVLDFAPELAVTDLRLLSEGDAGGEPRGFFEATLHGTSLSRTVLNYGGRPLDIVIEDGTASVRVEVADDVRGFVERFQAAYPESEVVAQRVRAPSQQPPSAVLDALTETLTDRQLETLQTAYFSGYFEEPRARTASEVAASLGIAQPTFSSHLHAAERKLCRELFERRPAN